MISYLKGRVIISKVGFAIIETGGVGYGININQSVVLKNNESVELFIHEHIREDSDDLYGFPSYEELDLFQKLISVNGVGPKAGLNIMSQAKPGRIIQAISRDDLSFFIAISGIGKKVAAKIVLDLKSKLSGDKNIGVFSELDGAGDVMDALVSLGYKQTEIQSLIIKIPGEVVSSEDKVRWCLKNLGR
ncbi:MAG: Holliday junction branch migration protein RuvA [Patescibacteria group bacterium]